MDIKTVSCGPVKSNCYIVSSGKTAVVIDPGFLEPELESYISSDKILIEYILLTHRHFDHILAAAKLREITNAKIAISAEDECGLYCDDDNLTDICCGAYGHSKGDERADIILSDGDIINAGDMSFKCIATHGHSAGGMCFLLKNCLFSGDTLFAGTAGRTDLPGGSIDELMKSLKRLSKLDPETEVYPGHGRVTTIGLELKNNPFLRGI